MTKTHKIVIGAAAVIAAWYVFLFKGGPRLRPDLASQLIDPYADDTSEEDNGGGTIQVIDVVDVETGDSSGPGDVFENPLD